MVQETSKMYPAVYDDVFIDLATKVFIRIVHLKREASFLTQVENYYIWKIISGQKITF